MSDTDIIQDIEDSDESTEVKALMRHIVSVVEDGKTRHPDADPFGLDYFVHLSAQDAGVLLATVEAFGNVFDVPEEVKLASLRLNLAYVQGAVDTLDAE